MRRSPTSVRGRASEGHAAAVNPYDWHMLRGDPRIARLIGIGLTRPKIITGQEFLTSGSVLVGGENPLENDAVPLCQC